MSWQTQHSVIAAVPLSAVWAWHCRVDNWARLEGDAVQSMTIDGPFQSGAQITTTMRGQPPRRATLRSVEPPHRTVIETELVDARLRFTWTFEALSEHQTRLTQRILLEGPGAGDYVTFMEEHFAANLPQGMERMAKQMESAAES